LLTEIHAEKKKKHKCGVEVNKRGNLKLSVVTNAFLGGILQG